MADLKLYSVIPSFNIENGDDSRALKMLSMSISLNNESEYKNNFKLFSLAASFENVQEKQNPVFAFAGL